MIIDGFNVIASPDARMVLMRHSGGQQFWYSKTTFEALITYLKGVRDGMPADGIANLTKPAEITLAKPDLETLITYLKGVRDGRGWNRSK